MRNPEIVQEEVDILLIGGGMACCGAAYEIDALGRGRQGRDGHRTSRSSWWTRPRMDRSGAVAQGLSAINTYIGPEQDPADYARMVSNDLMGITRDDLAYDLGRVRRRLRAPVRGVGPADLEDRRATACVTTAPSHRQGSARAEGRRQAGAFGQVADHDQRRILQVDRRRSRQEGPGHGPHRGAHLHRSS
ncbi:MAG: hypothetical protein MZV65_12890 [Chromatiales bacterium]|nr:hypothetical protein [Chromatiales bacterium]